MIQHTPRGAWFPVFRPYTPINDLIQDNTLELLIKKYLNGQASTHLHRLRPGDTLTMWGPRPGLWTIPREERDILMIAGGAGIAPIYSLARGILSDSESKARIRLLWGVHGMEDIVLKNELESLEKRYPDRLQVTYAVSSLEDVSNATVFGNHLKFREGRIDKNMIREAIQKHGRPSTRDRASKTVFLCGPPAMENALAGKQGVLNELGITPREVHRF